jgi:hypothetical protein
MNIRSRIRSQLGTSFLEVMIALVIMGVVTTGIFELYISQHKHYVVQDDITTIQQNVRASIDEITRHCRMAGFNLPLNLTPIQAYNTDPDTIILVYRTDDCETKLSAPMPQPSAELKCESDVSCFSAGDWAYIFEPDSGGGEFFEITHVQVAAKHIQHNTMPLSRKYSADAQLLMLTWIKFYVDTLTDPNTPCLMVERPGSGPQVFAENISDLQFQYRMKNGVVFDEPPSIDDVREILISVTGHSGRADYDIPSGDTLRYRTFNTSVFLRNIGL